MPIALAATPEDARCAGRFCCANCLHPEELLSSYEMQAETKGYRNPWRATLRLCRSTVCSGHSHRAKPFLRDRDPTEGTAEDHYWVDCTPSRYDDETIQRGSVSYYTLVEKALAFLALYRSAAFIDFLTRLVAARVMPCPDDDPHAYALYFYTDAEPHGPDTFRLRSRRLAGIRCQRVRSLPCLTNPHHRIR